MALQFTLNTVAASTVDTDCVVVGAYTNGSLTAAGGVLDRASNGALTRLVQRGDVSGKAGATTLLHDLAGVSAPRVLVVGLGDAAKLNAAGYIKAIGAAIKALKTGAAKRVALTLSELAVPGRNNAWAIRQAVIAADHAAYRSTAPFGHTKPETGGVAEVLVLGDDAAALATGIALAAGVEYARELGN